MTVAQDIEEFINGLVVAAVIVAAQWALLAGGLAAA